MESPLRGIRIFLSAISKSPPITHYQWTVNGVLSLFGKQKKAVRRKYQRFIQDGIGQGKRPELTGGGLLLRSTGGWGVLTSMRRMKEHLKGDERILGDSDFVLQVLESAQERMEESYRLSAEGYTFE